MDKPRASVPCGSCHACCVHEIIILHPEDGDDPARYLTKAIIHPLTGAPALALLQKPDGRCVYLSDEGRCRIHERAPKICRAFDCRGFVRNARRQMGADFETMLAASETMQAGVRMIKKGKRK